MKGRKFKSVHINTVAIIAVVALILFAVIEIFMNNSKQNQTSQTITNPEILRSLTYKEVDDKAEEDNEYVKFVAFFTRDLDNDGYAEKLKGTCRDVNESDELYLEFNVLTDGYLTDGKITVNDPNFTWNTALVSDSIVNGNYIGKTTSIKLQENIPAGSQKVFWGTINADIGNNINNYSKETTITLTGTHVSDSGVKTPINKTTKIIVDWHGDVGAKISNRFINKKIEEIKTDENSVKFEIELSTNEPNSKLILKENSVTAEIPLFKGYAPTSVTTEGEHIYDAETRTLTVTRNSVVDENGNITQSLARSNSYKINIEYPIEAYNILDESVTLEIPLTTYYIAYNNNNEEFENPVKSNIAKDIVAINYSKVTGYVYKFGITVGGYSRFGYTVSKEKILQLYNGETDETEEDYYNVAWNISRGNLGNITSMVMKEQPEKYTDEFLNSSNEFSSILEYTENIGIYFTGASKALGDDGYIRLYNDETDELIHTFTKDDWNTYTAKSIYKYEKPIKHIRIETGNVAQNSNFTANSVKEINDELLVEKISKEEFDEIKYIYSYLEGSVLLEGKTEMDKTNHTGIAKFLEEKSNARISSNIYYIETGKIIENYNLYIDTEKSMYNDANWENGQFIVKLPSEIVALRIKDVTVNEENVEILGYEVFEQDGCYFIKILTENEKKTTYRITINCEIAPDPSSKTCSRELELYAFNENGDSYANPKTDLYDVDNDGNTDENVQYAHWYLDFISPSTIVTTQYISEFSDKATIKIAPNVVNLPHEQKTAKINVALLNNYSRSIDEVKVLGVIPTEGNSYIVNGSSLDSKFSVTMNENGLQIPEELQNIVKVYYSEKINPTKDVTNDENGWSLTPTDWSKVKTYLIDFEDYIIPAGKSYTFTYGINVPEKVDYNKISYSEHAVYFALDTEGGKLLTQTEPSKLGIRIIRNYEFELVKTKEGFESLGVPGATYKLTYKDYDDTDVSKILITDTNGKISLENLFVGIEYTVNEIKTPTEYLINNNNYKFIIKENDEGKLYVETENTDNVLFDEQTEKAIIKTEDEPKYNLIITKKDSNTGEVLPDVEFELFGKKYITDAQGKIKIDLLRKNQQYTIKENRAVGYYINEDITFKLLEDENGNLILENNSDYIKNIVINNSENEHLIQVEFDIVNDKIPTFHLQVLKVGDKEGFSDLKFLEGAVFKLYQKDLNIETELTTNSSGIINVNDLYKHVEGKYITGEYTLTEIEPPAGYSNKPEEINFKLSSNSNGEVSLVVEDRENLESVKQIYWGEDYVTIFIKNNPIFKLEKTDYDTEEALANAKFTIKEVDGLGNEIGWAKDVEGNYIGELNNANEYILTTDETGIINLPIAPGNYKVTEVEFPEGYNEEYGGTWFFTIDDKESEDSSEEMVEINCIEDLVKLSKAVNNSNNYSGKRVVLMRDLDCSSNASYKNPQDREFGDLDGDGLIEGIKDEMIGGGFEPIGKDNNNYFSGIFDGNGKEIKNMIIMDKYNYVGLFGKVSNGGKIENLGLKYGRYSLNCSAAGGIVGYLCDESTVSNCYSTLSISNNRWSCSAGGIVGRSENSTVINCYNSGYITAWISGGIVGEATNTIIDCCYNIGDIEGYGQRGVGYASGIASSFDTDNGNIITNCYNSGYIHGKGYGYGRAHGIGVAKVIRNCYNVGRVYGADGQGNGVAYAIGEAQTKSNVFCPRTGLINTNSNNPILDAAFPGETYMKSESFVNMLNGYNGNAWVYVNNSYPKLMIKMVETKTIRIKNRYKKYKITSAVGLNSENKRIGGTITGEKLSDVEQFIEEVNIGSNSVNEIIATPEPGYSIVKITINGEEIAISPDENGVVTLPVFENVCEDKHIVVVFEKNNYSIEIKKENESNEPLEGAVFEIESPTNETFKVASNSNGIANLGVQTYGTYKIKEIKAPDGYKLSDEVTEVEILPTDTTKTIIIKNEKKDRIKIIKVDEDDNNIKIPGVKFKVFRKHVFHAEAEAVNVVSGYYDWNESMFSGGKGVDFATDLNFEFSLENDTECTFKTAGKYFAGRTFKLEIDGNEFGTYTSLSNTINYDTISFSLGTIQAGNHKIRISTPEGYAPVYDYFTIDKVGDEVKEFTTYVETDENGEAEITVPEFGIYGIQEIKVPEKYEIDTKIKDVEISTIGTKEVTITNKMKKHKITTKVERAPSQTEDGGTISGKDEQPYESVVDKEDSKKDILITPDEGYVIEKIKINNNEIEFSPDENGRVLLDKFTNMTEDKLVVVKFRKINLNSNLKIIKVDENNSEIKLSGAKFKVEQSGKDLLGELTDSSNSETTHHFIKNGDVYESTNAGVDNSVASSYIPINLTEITDATINIRIDVKISSESGHDYGFLDITNSPEVPDYRNSDDKVSGNRSMYYTGTLEGGYVNYLHFCYVKDEANSSNNDKFSITNISITLTYPEITTNSNGEAEISVFSGIDTKITEIKAPSGYELDETVHNVVINKGEKKEVTLTNKIGFIIRKIDEKTNEPLPEVQFAIYNLTTGGDFAKDKLGNYIGKMNEDGLYVVSTNENGEIIATLPVGNYKAVEVKGTEQYYLPEKEEDRTIYFKISKGENVKIDTIEDLIELSNSVVNGNTYYGRTILLNRDLDFNDINSYRNYENKTIDEIKADLGISENGFNPIGLSKDSENNDVVSDFEGIFEGNGHTINNFYSKSSYGSLFSSVKNGAIRNLNMTNVNSISNSCGAAIVRNAKNSTIINCSVSGEINGKPESGGTSPVGGIVYDATNCYIINCSNSAKVEGVYACGIASYIKNSTIDHCNNTGEIIGTSPAGGIAYTIENSTISNSYNTASVSGSGCTGGIASNINDSKIKNCYNTGKITDNAPTGGIAYSIRNTELTNVYNSGEVISNSSPAGGFAQSISGGKIYNCYNAGNVSGKYGAGGIAQSISNVEITNVYNTGNVISSDSNSAGIGTYISSTQITNCYNEGNVTSDTTQAGGIANNMSSCIVNNCYNNGQVSGKNGIGGIAYTITSNSKLTKCANKADIDAPSSGIGGIAYNASDSTFEECCNSGNLHSNPGSYGLMYSASNCKINRCYNIGTISSSGIPCGLINTGTNSYLENSFNTGEVIASVPATGLIYSSNGMVINNCYNAGNVTGQYGVSALISSIQTDSTTYINNCYNAGKITNIGQYGSSYIISKNDNINISNLYYLNGTASYEANGVVSVDGITPKSGIQMKSSAFVTELNNNKDSDRAQFTADSWKYNENGYPTLDFENEDTEINIEIPEIEELKQQQVSEKRFKNATDELTINNSKKATVYVHHLLEGSTPENPVKLAPDETIEGKENHDYTTAPRMDIEGYNLIKDENGEYIIPENASGKFTLEAQDVYYYYNVKPLELIVHHYLEGTEEKLYKDEHSYYNENEHYKTNPSEEVLKAYDLVLVVGDEEKDITENEEVIYFYKQKEHKITTKVEIPEDEANEGRTEKGGTILGEDEIPYEVVKHGENSVKDINARPDEGYKLLSITVNGELIPYEENEGIISINKFENMTEDKEVVVKYTPIVGKVITHHYLQGTTQKLHDDVIDIDKVGQTVTTGPVDIKGHKLVDSEGNKDENGNVVIVKEISEGVEEIIYYYQESYIITTDVIEHIEKYKDGTVKSNIKGGSITNEDVVAHEVIQKYEQNEKIIEMKPAAGYEIAKIVINENDITNLEPDNDGKVTIPVGYFKNVQHDIHVEVEYRAKSKVIVKYLEDETENEIFDSTQITGYEGKEFETSSKNIPGYLVAKVPVSEGSTELIEKITDENNNKINPNGKMFRDDITIIYWYKKINAGVVERHIETNAKDEETVLDIVVHDDSAGTNVETSRKEYSRCVSTNAPETTKEFIENNYSNVTLVEKSKDTLTVTSSADTVKEVWYYYVKQYNLTTEVKKHAETKNGETVYVEGGSISKQYKYDDEGNEVETTFEVIDNRANSTKEIKMTPDDGYIIKSVTINDTELLIDNMIDEDGSLTIPVGYFKDVQKDYHVVVEYEKVPAKVIVKYIDEYTKESIIPDKVIDGFVTDEYNEPRVEIEGYIPAEPEPDNYKGNMTKETTTVVYYYQKQFKITTDVIEHYENKDEDIINVPANKNNEEKEKILVKGGSIQGEDENPFEAVLRGNDNTEEILIKPDSGYRIKSLTIKDGQTEYNLSVTDMVKDDNTIVLPGAYFKNMQADKHITVEFERIPSKVIVKYLEKDSEDPVAETEIAEGFVGNKYVTQPKEVLNYKLINDELPGNAEGKLAEKDTIVIYYYEKEQKAIEPAQEEKNNPDDSYEQENNSNTSKNNRKGPQTGDNIVIVAIVEVLAVIICGITRKMKKTVIGKK